MSAELVTITIDGKEVQVPQGMLLVEAAKMVDTDIPVFCYHPKMEPAGVCRMCLVEVEGQRKPVTACTMPVSDGMVVNTKSELVQDLQKGVIEFLLLNHPLDCPVCDKGGECPLQDHTFKFGAPKGRSLDPKVRKDKAVDLGNFIVFDQERCILCRRCTRFDNEITGEDHLVVVERAHETTISTADGEPFNSYFSGNTIEMCPVGALTSDLYRFKGRPWDVSRSASVCTGCSVGCNISLDFRFGQLTRVINRENPETDGGWLCDRGRFNYTFVGADNRVQQPLMRKNGELVPVTWEEAISEITQRLRKVIRDHSGSAIGGIGGGRLTNEEAYLFQKMVRTVFESPHVDWRVGEQYVASNNEFAGLLTDIDEANGVLLVDILPAERAPVADLRIRRVIERGGATLAAVGPAMPAYRPSIHEFPALGRDIDRTLADDKLFELFKNKERIVVLWGGRDGQVGAALVELLNKLKQAGSEVRLLIPGEQTNARGAEAMGVHPQYLPGFRPVVDEKTRAQVEHTWQANLASEAGWSTDEMLQQAVEGKLQAMYLASANLMNTYPDRELVEKALDRVPFLVVQDLFLTETAAKADVVLPVASFPAKTGHYTTLDGRVQRVDAAMEPEFETQTDYAIFKAVADALGVRLSGTAKELEWEMQGLIGEGINERLPAAPSDMTVNAKKAMAPLGASSNANGSEQLILVHVERLFAGGGTSYFDEGTRRARPGAVAALHPDDAVRLQLTTGDHVVLKNAKASLTLEVKADRRVLPGTVQVPKGLVEQPTNSIASMEQVSLSKLAVKEVG